jgi:hypothetical protein
MERKERNAEGKTSACQITSFISAIFIFSAKKFRGKYSERIWVFHCRYSIRKKPRVIVLALPSNMM